MLQINTTPQTQAIQSKPIASKSQAYLDICSGSTLFHKEPILLAFTGIDVLFLPTVWVFIYGHLLSLDKKLLKKHVELTSIAKKGLFLGFFTYQTVTHRLGFGLSVFRFLKSKNYRQFSEVFLRILNGF